MTASTTIPFAADLRRVPMKSLRASLGAMASRGETTGPRVEAARAALEWQRNRALLIDKIGMGAVEAEDLLDAMAETDSEAKTAVAR